MVKDSRSSSAASSAHVSSREDSVEVAVQSQDTNIPSDQPRKSQSISMTDSSKKASDKSSANLSAAESQPITATSSDSSNPPTKDAIINGAGPAAPYGTRSRNRTGNSRPNYAEDKELDAEFEVAPPPKEGRKSRAAEPDHTSDTGRPTSTSRKTLASDFEQPLTIQHHIKEPIPGTSTFSANPGATGISSLVSKKRKATGLPLSATTHAQQPVAVQGFSSTQAVLPRASMAAHALAGYRESNMLSFDNCGGQLESKKLVADDGTILEVNDHVYLVCEPPGEPYYLGRIMEFLHVSNDSSQPIDALRLNWYYRPKDIGRKVNDTRQVFASMHSDISPLTALRGKCQIKHKSQVEKLDELRKTKDCFWYEKLYDRYIHRYYDVIPTSQVINVPMEVKKVLDERWMYIVVEPGRGKELTSAVKSCKRCSKYCASNDSVDCAVCRNTYHMSCVNPPLLKKPSRGFAWACGPCSKAQEKKLEARNTPTVTDSTIDADVEEFNEEDEGTPGSNGDTLDTGRTSPTISTEPGVLSHPGTTEQIHQASLWLFRYLGIHCKVEDALDYDDRIYPRASSRLGPRHQANISSWPGRPIEYVKPIEIKKKYVKGGAQKKDAKLSKDTVAAVEAEKLAREKRPKWMLDEPPGYVHRGEDYDSDDPNSTAQLLFKLPEPGEILTFNAKHVKEGSDASETNPEQIVSEYMSNAAKYAKSLGLPAHSTNLLDVALHLLHTNNYDQEKALDALSRTDKKIFKEPELTGPELKKFEDGVTKFGSEWHSIKKHVKTISAADVVRFYYTWKKTERGSQVWGNYSGRKGKKEAKRAEATTGKLQDDVADEFDDSAFDNDKAYERKRGFQCKFCTTRSSRQWRRAPNTPAGTMISDHPGSKVSGKDKGAMVMVALCRRCAELWRRYAIQWEDIDEVAKKVSQAGGRAWKRKIDEELLKELVSANEVANHAPQADLPPVTAGGTTASLSFNTTQAAEHPRKKVKSMPEKEFTETAPETASVVTASQKKKIVPENPPIPPIPEPPKAKTLPCAICGEMEPMGDQHLSCKDCRMTVHRNCYGVVGDNRSPSKWVCDMCSNDKNPQVSIQYKCMLCPVEFTEHDFIEPPKVTSRKRSEKDRDREKIDRQNAQKVAEFFRKKQEEMNKPINPREPLKRTANNNWVHVTCAVFTPEVKFANAKALEPSEGIPSIASVRYDEVCKACNRTGGACVGCYSCRAPVHVACAHQAGYLLGFDIAPVKGSRRDQFNIVSIHGEVGTMTAAIWCKEHIPTKTIVHRMHDIVDDTGLNALQLYVQNFKQADLALTGTVRKATLVNQSTKAVVSTPIANTSSRRISTTTGTNSHLHTGRTAVPCLKADGIAASDGGSDPGHKCSTCNIDVSPKWWPFPPMPQVKPSSTSLATSIEPCAEQTRSINPPTINGLVDSDATESESHAALAAAALHQNTAKPRIIPAEFQCHQCHWKKVRKQSTPPPPAPPPPPPIAQREPSRPPNNTAASTGSTSVDLEAGPPRSHYGWQPASYSANGPYSQWPRPSPTPQALGIVNQMNGSHSPHISPGVSQTLSGQTQLRQPVPSSPRQNGMISHGPNGYPPSPHHGIGPGTLHMSSSSYTSYAATRPPPQHLTNGGPPPRAPEHPLSSANGHIQPRASFSIPQGSPPMHRDTHSQVREISVAQNNPARQNDGRINGGASASPSLRNLLS